MVGDNIKRLRMEHHMTQKELADQLFVTAQAVSRWEKGDVEPSLRTIAELAKIFEVPSDVILGIDEPEANEPPRDEFQAKDFSSDNDAEYQQHTQGGFAPQMLALCEECNRPIYEKDEIVRIRKSNGSLIRCRECHQRIEQTIALNMEQQRVKKEKKAIKKAKRARIKCITLAIFLIAWFLTSFFYVMMDTYAEEAADFIFNYVVVLIVFYVVFSIFACCWLRNTFFGKMLATTALFLFDLLNDLLNFDDFIFWVIFGVVYLIALAIGFIAALIAAIFVAPFLCPIALRRNIKHPELTKLTGFWEIAD